MFEQQINEFTVKTKSNYITFGSGNLSDCSKNANKVHVPCQEYQEQRIKSNIFLIGTHTEQTFVILPC